jgi:hypothetical protein
MTSESFGGPLLPVARPIVPRPLPILNLNPISSSLQSDRKHKKELESSLIRYTAKGLWSKLQLTCETCSKNDQYSRHHIHLSEIPCTSCAEM